MRRWQSKVEIGRVVVARRENIVGTRPKVPISLEQALPIQRLEILAQLGAHGIQVHQERPSTVSAQHPKRNKRIQTLNSDEACAGKSSERPGAIPPAILQKPEASIWGRHVTLGKNRATSAQRGDAGAIVIAGAASRVHNPLCQIS
jgi:hypothetical protein